MHCQPYNMVAKHEAKTSLGEQTAGNGREKPPLFTIMIRKEYAASQPAMDKPRELLPLHCNS